MAKYVCEELYNNSICLKWVEYQTSFDMIAISGQEARLILYGSLLVVFSAVAYRHVLNLFYGRKY